MQEFTLPQLLIPPEDMSEMCERLLIHPISGMSFFYRPRRDDPIDLYYRVPIDPKLHWLWDTHQQFEWYERHSCPELRAATMLEF